MKFAIIGDVSCDLSPELRKQFGLEYVEGYLSLPDGREIKSKLDWEGESCEAFYDALKKNPDGYLTAPAPAKELYEIFKKYAEKGIPVIHTAMSSKMSGTHDFACAARDMVLAEIPDAKIYPFDTRKFAAGAGLLTILAAVKRDEGLDAEQTVEYLESVKNLVHQAGWHDDLAFSAKKGRISNAKAFMGTLVGIKPVGDFSQEGMTTVLAKIKGERTAFKVLLDYIGETVTDPEDQIMIVASSNRRKPAEKFMEMIKERFNPKAIYYTDIYRTSGTNAGPGIMACYYIGKPLTADLEEERALLARLNG